MTLPAEVREALGVGEGDIVEFEVLSIRKKKTDLGTVESPETATTTSDGGQIA